MSKPFAQSLRSQFPALHQQVHNRPLVYLDNGATTHKPFSVIEAESEFYRTYNANIHRSPHLLGQRATEHYERVRNDIARFLSAEHRSEIIFTKGTTESLNLIAYSYGALSLSPGDEILVSELEHHSNIVPWQIVAQKYGASVKAITVSANGELDRDSFLSLLGDKTKIVSVAHVSNALGTVNPVKWIIEQVRILAPKAVVVIDGAQWVAHAETNVKELDCDFYVFSAHKMFGPTGIGVLYGKKDILERMPPFQGGGDMIETVDFTGSTYATPPHRFEAGTPNIAGVVGLGAAVEFLTSLDWADIALHEADISSAMLSALQLVPGVQLVGEAPERIAVASFRVKGFSDLDVATMLDYHGIAIRAGHHCCMPLMKRLAVDGTARVSWALYTTLDDVDRFEKALSSIVSGKGCDPVKPSQVITFAEARAQSVQGSVLDLKTTLAAMPDQEGRHELLMQFGKSHPAQLELLRDYTPALSGCMSEVRLVVLTDGGRVRIASDSNAHIVRGLLEVVDRAFSGQKISELLDFNPQRLLDELGLAEFVSFQRRNGLQSVLNKLQFVAQQSQGQRDPDPLKSMNGLESS